MGRQEQARSTDSSTLGVSARITLMNKRPLSITLLSYLLIAVGAAGFVFHFSESYKRHSFASDDVLVLAVSLLAIVCGVFLLRGKDWARWLSMAWIAFHVVLSFFHSMREVAVHALFLLVFAVLLFRPAASQFFRRRALKGE
jgi:hypothetical protein